MSKPRNIEPVIRICAVIAADDRAISTAVDWLANRWGAIAEMSEPVPFKAGGFYDDTMGPGLQKVLVACKEFADPAGLVDWKRQTNQWEMDLIDPIHQVSEDARAVARPINLDAGYLTQAKLVLATIKDRDHRIYLRDQIFAEVTLNYVGKRWVHHRWTYPSYRTEEVSRFANHCRDRLREHILANDLTRKAV